MAKRVADPWAAGLEAAKQHEAGIVGFAPCVDADGCAIVFYSAGSITIHHDGSPYYSAMLGIAAIAAARRSAQAEGFSPEPAG